jgi:hypothetical protein
MLNFCLVFIIFQNSAVGAESRVSLTDPLQNSHLAIVSVPDTVAIGETLAVVANLSLVCDDGQTAALPNRLVLFFISQDNCGVDIGQVAEETSYTDASGNASFRLAFADTGFYRLRVRFQGENKPDPCPDTGNNACSPLDSQANQRCVNISSANDCATVVVVKTLIPIYIQAHSPVNLIVTDPAGDSIGVSFNTISGAYYGIYNDSIYIEEALSGNYLIEVTRDTLDFSNDSSYAIGARIDGTADNVLTSSAPVPEEGEVHNYIITSDPSIPQCLSKPGDANADGYLTLVDIISTVNYIFNYPGCLPLPDCWLWGLNCRGDWNGDGQIILSDVIQGVNFIFNRPNGPWTPVANWACCLSVE